MKSFKQYISEIEKFDIDKKRMAFKPESNEKIAEKHTPISSGKVGDYDVTVAESKAHKLKNVFIHHNGKHVGTIQGKPNEEHGHLTVGFATLDSEHQGKGLIPKVYHHLMTHHKMTIKSDTKQSVGGNKIWENLHKHFSGISVKGIQNGKEVEPQFGFDHAQERYIGRAA